MEIQVLASASRDSFAQVVSVGKKKNASIDYHQTLFLNSIKLNFFLSKNN